MAELPPDVMKGMGLATVAVTCAILWNAQMGPGLDWTTTPDVPSVDVNALSASPPGVQIERRGTEVWIEVTGPGSSLYASPGPGPARLALVEGKAASLLSDAELEAALVSTTVPLVLELNRVAADGTPQSTRHVIGTP